MCYTHGGQDGRLRGTDFGGNNSVPDRRPTVRLGTRFSQNTPLITASSLETPPWLPTTPRLRSKRHGLEVKGRRGPDPGPERPLPALEPWPASGLPIGVVRWRCPPPWVPWTECQSRSSREQHWQPRALKAEHGLLAPLACSAGRPSSPPSLNNRLLPGLSGRPAPLWLLLWTMPPHRQAALAGGGPSAAQGSSVKASQAQAECGGRVCQRGFPRSGRGDFHLISS